MKLRTRQRLAVPAIQLLHETLWHIAKCLDRLSCSYKDPQRGIDIANLTYYLSLQWLIKQLHCMGRDWYLDPALLYSRLLLLLHADRRSSEIFTKMSGGSSRRTSTASTSSLPRTPASAKFERDGYSWADSGSPPLVDAFTGPSLESQSSPSIAHSVATSSGATTGHLACIGEDEDATWHLNPKSAPAHALTFSSAHQDLHENLSRPATYHSTFDPVVRLWPQPPPQHPNPEDPKLWEEVQKVATMEPESYSAYREDEGRSSTPESEGDTLKRRRHIRRPSRQKPGSSRPLPPLPSAALSHSQSTAGRFVHAPATIPEGDELPTPDMRPRPHTLNVLTSAARPLPPVARQIPQRETPSPPQLKLATLDLRSLPSETGAVLTKTPNRPTHPFGDFTTAPSMPADAGTQIDWDLIEDMLEADVPTPVSLVYAASTQNRVE